MEEMNAYMLQRWNEKVRKNDEVVILGDLSWGKAEETNELLGKLNGRLYLIQGNHDRFLKNKDYNASRFVWIKPYEELQDNNLVILPDFCVPFLQHVSIHFLRIRKSPAVHLCIQVPVEEMRVCNIISQSISPAYSVILTIYVDCCLSFAINNHIVCNQAGKINCRFFQLQNLPLAVSYVCYGK